MFILKELKVLYFHTLLQVFILRVFTLQHELCGCDRLKAISGMAFPGHKSKNASRIPGVTGTAINLPDDYSTREVIACQGRNARIRVTNLELGGGARVLLVCDA